jgi:hypothetical protein
MIYRQLNADYSAIEFADFFESVSMRLIALGFAELGYYRIRKRGQRKNRQNKNDDRSISRDEQHRAPQQPGTTVRGGSRVGVNQEKRTNDEYEDTSSSATDEVSD